MQLITLLFVAACGLSDALLLSPGAGVRVRTPLRAVQVAPTMQIFGKKEKPTLAELGYWEGEWVCADCGYIYEPGTEPPFEELRSFWKCPQCAGPRRRFAKKAGGMVAGLDDTPIQIFTYLSLAAIAILLYQG